MAVDIGGSDSMKSEPNVVPLCDILLVLLIIFMVITPALTKGANITLPDAEYTVDQPKPGEMITISIGKREDGSLNILLNEETILDLNKLTDFLRQKITEDQPKDKTKVLLKAHQDIEYGKIIDVMNEIKNADIEVIGLLVEKTKR